MPHAKQAPVAPRSTSNVVPLAARPAPFTQEEDSMLRAAAAVLGAMLDQHVELLHARLHGHDVAAAFTMTEPRSGAETLLFGIAKTRRGGAERYLKLSATGTPLRSAATIDALF